MNIDILKLLPLLSLLIFIIPCKVKGWWAVTVTLAGCLAALVGAVCAFTGYTVPYMPTFTPLSALFVITIAIIGITTTIYAAGYLRSYIGKRSSFEFSIHYASLVTLIYSMLMVVSATERFEFLLWWELMTISSFILILWGAERKAVLHAAISYLVVMHVGFFCILIGLGVMPSDALWGYGSMPLWTWVLLLVGFGLKAGIFPLHIWLPVAHPAAPSHVSALMSGVMITMGIYGIIRITLGVTDFLTAGYILFIIGVVTALFGVSKAAVQNDLKRLLAYSSIDNMGIIVMGLGLGFIGKACANTPLALLGIGGALIHMLNHAGYKTLLFLSAGSVAGQTHSTMMSAMGGLLKRMPLTGVIFLIATFAICAIPPFSGFFSEFALFMGMFEALSNGTAILEASIGILTLAIVGGLTILTFAKAYGVTMLGTPRSAAASAATEVSPVMLAAQAIPLVSIVLGSLLYPYVVFSNSVAIFDIASTTSAHVLDSMIWIAIAATGLIVAMVGLIILRKILQRKRAMSMAPTWGCGFTAQTAKIQYNAHAVSAELQNLINVSAYDSPLDANDVYPTSDQSSRRVMSDKTTRLFTNFTTHLMRRWTARLALFQTGRTNHYVLHALLFLILILILSVLGIL